MLLGEMGGLGDALFLIGALLTNLVASQLFSMSVAHGMYRYNIARVADDNPNPKYKRSHS